MSDIRTLMEDERSFHSEVVEPWYIVYWCHLFGRKTPREILLYELDFLLVCWAVYEDEENK